MHSEKRYRRAAKAGGVGVWEWNIATGQLYVDPVLKELLGYEEHEIRDEPDDWRRLVHAADWAAARNRARAHLAGECPLYEIELRMVHRDGGIRWFLVRGSVTRDAKGRALSMAGACTEITGRKRAEEALRQAEENNRLILESTRDCVEILDLDGRVLHLNDEGLRMLELEDASSASNRAMTDFYQDGRAADEALAAARHGACGRFRARLRTASGSRKWLDTVVTPIMGANDEVVRLLAVSRDVTEQRRQETLRAAQHEMLERIASGSALPDVLDWLVRCVEQLSDGLRCSVLLLDEDGATMKHAAAPSLPPEYVRTIDGTRIGTRAGSCGTAMFVGTTVIVSDILSDPLWEECRDVARRSGLRACWSVPIFSPQRNVLGSLAMYYGEPRTPGREELWLIESAAYIAGIAIEQQHAQHALRESEARNSAILRAIPDWMFLLTVDGTYLDCHVNDVTSLYAPPSAFLGKNVREVLPPDLAESFVRAFERVNATDEPEIVEYALGSGGEERFYEAHVVRCHGDKILSIVRDVTDRKHAEVEAATQRRELAHLSRVAVLGELTGALAHELSQPLTAGLSNALAARLLLERDPLDAKEVKEALDDIISDNRRAGSVIDRLRALLRKEGPELQTIDVNDVIREVLDLAHSEILSRRINVTTALAPGAALVSGDRVQLQQVILNLLLNACEALSEVPVHKRRLTVETKIDGGAVHLAVSDRGAGIPKDELERVFEPFVSFRDGGLGLGLAISRSIVLAHGGSLRAENNAEGGATFRCYLPITDAGGIERAAS
jgi:PAS domain S-box-containing protein